MHRVLVQDSICPTINLLQKYSDAPFEAHSVIYHYTYEYICASPSILNQMVFNVRISLVITNFKQTINL